MLQDLHQKFTSGYQDVCEVPDTVRLAGWLPTYLAR